MVYQLVFRFIIPIYRTTKQVKKGFRDMQNHMNGNTDGQPHQPASSKTHTQQQKNVGDYIDFEEVKD